MLVKPETKPATVYYKAAIGPCGELRLVPGDANPYHTLGAATFTLDEASNLELMDCRPVVVLVCRAFMVQSEVVEART